MAGFRLLDGSQLSPLLASASDSNWVPHDFPQSRHLPPSQCPALALSLVSDALDGIDLPSQLWEQALHSALFPSDSGTIVDLPTFTSKLKDILLFIITSLQENPLVVSVLDGSAIKSLLEDEDDFAMLAENLFTDLDAEDTGKISVNEIRTALQRMGLEMGIPVPSVKAEAEIMISSILENHLSAEEKEIGQAQFAQILQEILEELATSLAASPMIIILDVKVNNGSRLKKLLDADEHFSRVADRMFDECDKTKDGNLDRIELGLLLETQVAEWGLPPKGSSEQVEQLYSELFSLCDVDKSGQIDKTEFQTLLREIMGTFAEHLHTSPILVNLPS